MLEENKIHLGDCLDLMPSIPSKSVDMILCDLPYGTTACEWDSIIDMARLWQEYERVILDAIYQLTDQAIIDRLRELDHSYQGKIKEAKLFMHKMELI